MSQAARALEALKDYQRRSQAHTPGQPDQLGGDGMWRGVAYHVGPHRLVSEYAHVVEILPLPALTPIPGGLPWLLGLANIRGSLIPVVDLRQFLQGERTVLHEGQQVMVVRQSGGDVAVTIDGLYGQRSFEQRQLAQTREFEKGHYARFIERVYRQDDQTWGVFNLEQLTRSQDFRQAAA